MGTASGLGKDRVLFGGPDRKSRGRVRKSSDVQRKGWERGHRSKLLKKCQVCLGVTRTTVNSFVESISVSEDNK